MATLILIWVGAYFLWPRPSRIKIGRASIKAEIRDTEAGRSLGLSGRQSLPEEEGMLFVFDRPDVYEFWMKEMNFPLDFVWINHGVVVDLSEHIPAPDKLSNESPMTVRPKEPANWVLEVNSGWVEKHQIKLGDPVKML